MSTALETLNRRIDALNDGRPETECLLNTIKDIVNRYVFIAAYVAVNADLPEWSELAVELLETEHYWPKGTDPDVLALFEEYKAEEIKMRQERTAGGA